MSISSKIAIGIIALLVAVGSFAADAWAGMSTGGSVLPTGRWGSLILAVALVISEVAALIPSWKSNSVLTLALNLTRSVFGKPEAK